MKIRARRIFAFILLGAKLIIQCVSKKVLLTSIDNKCYTDSSSAVAAVYDLSNRHWKETKQIQSGFTKGKYISANSKRLCENLDCYHSGMKWKIQNSLELGSINSLVTDRRWEDFPMYIATPIPKAGIKDGTKYYQKVAVLNSNHFAIPISLQSEFNANVYICDRARCYWLSLQGENNTKTEFTTCINKCPSTTITTDKCHDWKTTNYNIFNIFNSNEWNHFKIALRNKELQFENQKGSILLRERVELNGVKEVFIRSKVVPGMWKIHDFNYLYSETAGATVFKLKVARGHQCLSMFVTISNRCSMTIQLLDSIEARYPLASEFIKISDFYIWEETILCFNSPKQDLYLQVSTRIDERRGSTPIFWVLSDIRTTSRDDELRYITPDPAKWHGTCQLLNNDKVVDTQRHQIDVLENCKEDQLGEECSSCKQFGYEKCPERLKYCQLIQDWSRNIKTKCFCSIGYEGSNCQVPCGKNRYGHNCQGHCTNCPDGCENDKIFGQCNSPGNSLEKKKCDQRFGIYLFDKQPQIVPGVTECWLTQTWFAADGRTPKFYKFQYRQDGEIEWKDATKAPLKCNDSKSVILTNLKSKTTYHVRVFGYDKEEDLRHLSLFKDFITIHKFTTQRPIEVDKIPD